MRVLSAIAVMGLIAGCAAAPQEMVYFAEGRAPVNDVRWPAAPEVPRLTYSGELLGETNFRNVPGSRDPAAMRVLRWIVGLGQGRREMNQLLRPQSGIVDTSGRILVTDAGRQAVMVFDEPAGALESWEQAAPGVSFVTPVGICELTDGSYAVADSELASVFRLAANGLPLGALVAGGLERPTGLACDASRGEIYVADTVAHQVRVFDTNGTPLRTFGQAGVDPGEFNGPTHLALNDDRLYVTDTLNARVQVLERDGTPSNVIGTRGLFVGNLVRPKGVTVDRDGNVYVIESYYDHLIVFDKSGRLLLPVGGTGRGTGEFFLPAGAWSDGGNRLFVADMFNGRVVVLDYIGDGT